ncbi:MAG: hypothetical protein HQ565_11880 [Bacteroidetes bacterium]|nr:hypothetical protein [Bacteroidota bacterium]
MKKLTLAFLIVVLSLLIWSCSCSNKNHGLIGSYYKGHSINASGNIDISGLEKAFERTDSHIDFWDGNSNYAMNPIEGSNNDYTVVWNGYIYIEKPGQYGFGTISDDGSEVWIDDDLIVANAEYQWYDWEDNINEGDNQEDTFPPLILDVGYHQISVRFFEGGSYDGIKLYWLKPEMGESIIPYNGTSFSGIPPVFNENTNWEIVPNSVLFTKK